MPNIQLYCLIIHQNYDHYINSEVVAKPQRPKTCMLKVCLQRRFLAFWHMPSNGFTCGWFVQSFTVQFFGELFTQSHASGWEKSQEYFNHSCKHLFCNLSRLPLKIYNSGTRKISFVKYDNRLTMIDVSGMGENLLVYNHTTGEAAVIVR